MKTQIVRTFVLSSFTAALSALADAPAQADPFAVPDFTKTPVVQIQAEYVEVSQQTLLRLLASPLAHKVDRTALHEQVLGLVEKGEGKMLEVQLATTRSGNKVTTESQEEFTYPAEYEPANGIPVPKTSLTDEDIRKQVDRQMAEFSGFPYNPATPSAFDTRNLGSRLEAEPTLADDGKTVDLRFDPEIVWHTGNTTWLETKDANGNTGKVQTPLFYSLRLTTQLTCVTGRHSLAAILSPKDAGGHVDMTRKVMVFVKCDVLAVE